MEELTSELLSEVLGKEVFSFMVKGKDILPSHTSPIDETQHDFSVINKYEFMHLCKTFISDNYYAEINIYHNGCSLYLFKYKDGKDSFEYKSIMDSVGNKDEEEAVIKATKWVIENKDKS